MFPSLRREMRRVFENFTYGQHVLSSSAEQHLQSDEVETGSDRDNAGEVHRH